MSRLKAGWFNRLENTCLRRGTRNPTAFRLTKKPSRPFSQITLEPGVSVKYQIAAGELLGFDLKAVCFYYQSSLYQSSLHEDEVSLPLQTERANNHIKQGDICFVARNAIGVSHYRRTAMLTNVFHIFLLAN